MWRQVADSSAFQGGILAVVLAAAILVGLETDPRIVAEWGWLLDALDRIVVAIFVLEALIKMAAHGRRIYRYFADGWNVFDFAIVVVCLLPVEAHYAAALRLVRVVRVLRLVSVLPGLQLLVSSLLRSLPSMGYIGLLLAILFYVYGVTGVFLWRENDPAHFGDLPTAVLSLFRVVTLEDWTDLMYTQMYGSDRYPYELHGPVPTKPAAAPLLGAAYFVSFVLVGTMIVLNLFIGVILNSMTEAQRDREAQQRSRHLSKLGHTTVTDDLAELDEQLVALRSRLDEIRRHARHERLDR